MLLYTLLDECIHTHTYRKQEYILLTKVCIMMLVLAGMGDVCVRMCVCVSCVCCYRFAAAALALARSLFLSSTSCKHRKKGTVQSHAIAACQTTHLRMYVKTGCTLPTCMYVHADCACRPVLFVHMLNDLLYVRTHALPSGQANPTVKDSSHTWMIQTLSATTLWLVVPAKHSEISHWTLFTRRPRKI